MYCRNCGNEIKEKEKFCSKCGNKIVKINRDLIVFIIGITLLITVIIAGVILNNSNNIENLSSSNSQLSEEMEEVKTNFVYTFNQENLEEYNGGGKNHIANSNKYNWKIDNSKAKLVTITEDMLNIEFVEVDAGSIYSLLPDVACAVINCNYAIDFGLNPGADYIFRDDPSIYEGNSFYNLIAARTADKDNELYKKIVSKNYVSLKNKCIPFGPFLTIAAIIYMFFPHTFFNFTFE